MTRPLYFRPSAEEIKKALKVAIGIIEVVKGWMQIPFMRYWNWIADPFFLLLQALPIKRLL